MSTSRHRHAFTLVELLVVLAIIGILIALIVPAVSVVLYKARNTRISMEIAALAQAVEAYKNEAGDYPPNGNDWLLMKRHIAKRWQQMPPAQYTAFKNLAGGNYGADGAPSGGGKPLDPAEAMVFWLGGQSPNGGLRANDVLPLGTAGEPKQFYAFDQARFTDRDNDGWYEYAAPGCINAPFVYFDARSYAAYYPAASRFDVGAIDSLQRGKVHPLARVASPSTAEQFMSPNTFQIITAGQDGVFCKPADTSVAAFPDGPYTSSEQDNIANFTEGKTYQDSKP